MSATIQQRLSNLTPFNSVDQDVLDDAIAEIDSLCAQLAEAQKDAERYRWARANCLKSGDIFAHYNAAEPTWIDRQIDAAISALANGKEP